MNVRRLTLMLIVCLVSAALAFGQRDALSEARQLMAKLDYTDALKLLARTQREHPELRDETQPLIEQIISEQGEKYNQVLAQLIHVLYDEQDTDKALPLINILEGSMRTDRQSMLPGR